MRTSMFPTLRGYVLIEVQGERLERLINRLTEKRMSVWDIRIRDNARAELYISLGDFFRLRPLLKETGCRSRIRKRFGLPFWLDKLEKRKLFAAGMICFIVGLYVLSSVVWQVRVEGNEHMKTADILQAAQQEGIYKMQWKFKLKDADELSRSLQSKLPEAAWIGVEFRGTHVVIKVVEAVIPEKPPLLNPRHLVASKSALVTSIFAEKGRPVVKTNTYVKKGDILISGILGDELNQKPVVAAGEVKGLVWYTPKVEVPLVQQYKAYTGEMVKRNYLVVGNRALQLSGYGDIPYQQFETIPERKTIMWRDYVLPVGWLKERVMEVNTVERSIELEEAKMRGLEQAKADILAAAGQDSRVVSEKILHEKSENGKVYMEVHLEVEEPIAQEQPIVP